MDLSATGIQEVGGTTVKKLAFANRMGPVTASSLSEKFLRLPSSIIRSSGVRKTTVEIVERVTMAVEAAQQLVGVRCGINGMVRRIGE
jgi:hypothetical protein